MISIGEDLQLVKNNLTDFKDIAVRVLEYLPNVLSNSKTKYNYIIHVSHSAGTTKYIRPINKSLFIDKSDDFQNKFISFQGILTNIKSGNIVSNPDKVIIDSILYTIQQSIGAGLDLTAHQNSARKHVGNRFEELIRCVFTEIGISNKNWFLIFLMKVREETSFIKVKMTLLYRLIRV